MENSIVSIRKTLLILFIAICIFPLIQLIEFTNIAMSLAFAFLLPIILLLILEYSAIFRERLWTLYQSVIKPFFLGFVFTYFLSVFIVYLFRLYHQMLGETAYAWNFTYLKMSFFSIWQIIASAIIAVLSIQILRPIDRRSLLRIMDLIECKEKTIIKIIITTTNPASIWLKQRELLLYLISNIKMNNNKISRHIIGNNKIMRDYTNADGNDHFSLMSNPASFVRRSHMRSMGLSGHNINCPCLIKWKKMNKDDKTFILIKYEGGTNEIFTYIKSWDHIGFEQLYDTSRKDAIVAAASCLEDCTEKSKLA